MENRIAKILKFGKRCKIYLLVSGNNLFDVDLIVLTRFKYTTAKILKFGKRCKIYLLVSGNNLFDVDLIVLTRSKYTHYLYLNCIHFCYGHRAGVDIITLRIKFSYRSNFKSLSSVFFG